MHSSLVLSISLLHLIHAAVEQADLNSILQSHNKERSLSSAAEMKWDDKLSTSASKWADTCPDGHSPDDIRNGASENLGWGWPTMNASDVVQQWIAEKADVVGDGCAPGKQCGHYKIVVDKLMRSVGCATHAACPSSKTPGQTVMQVWVCHYSGEPGSGNNATNATNATTSMPPATSAPYTRLPPFTETQHVYRRKIPISDQAYSPPTECED